MFSRNILNIKEFMFMIIIQNILNSIAQKGGRKFPKVNCYKHKPLLRNWPYETKIFQNLVMVNLIHIPTILSLHPYTGNSIINGTTRTIKRASFSSLPHTLASLANVAYVRFRMWYAVMVGLKCPLQQLIIQQIKVTADIGLDF